MSVRQGEVWVAGLDPTVGHEQGGRRPCLVLSVDKFNAGPAGVVIVCPITTTERRLATHVRIEPPEGGVRTRSFAMSEAVRSVSTERLVTRWGSVETVTLRRVLRLLRLLTHMP